MSEEASEWRTRRRRRKRRRKEKRRAAAAHVVAKGSGHALPSARSGGRERGSRRPVAAEGRRQAAGDLICDVLTV
jgi:hypothetical protein